MDNVKTKIISLFIVSLISILIIVSSIGRLKKSVKGLHSQLTGYKRSYYIFGVISSVFVIVGVSIIYIIGMVLMFLHL
jgi:hypothetical protein